MSKPASQIAQSHVLTDNYHSDWQWFWAILTFFTQSSYISSRNHTWHLQSTSILTITKMFPTVQTVKLHLVSFLHESIHLKILHPSLEIKMLKCNATDSSELTVTQRHSQRSAISCHDNKILWFLNRSSQLYQASSREFGMKPNRTQVVAKGLHTTLLMFHTSSHK